MPKLPTRWDLGDPTNNLERPIRIASYNVGAIGRAGQHIAQGKKAAGAGMQQLASGMASLGGKLSAEEKRAAKAAGKTGKGGGGGSGRSGEYNRPALAGATGDGSEAPTTDTSAKDPTTGEAVTDTGTGMPVAPTNRPARVKSSMTTSDAFTSNAFFISGQKTQLEEDARSWTPEMVKSPDFVKEYMAGLKVLGQDHFAPIDGSPLITDTNAGKMNTNLVKAYLAIAESAAKKRAAILGVAAVKTLGEASVKVHGPQYADNTVDPVPVWEDEKIAIKTNRNLDQAGRDAALKASSINASRRYLSRFPYDQQLAALDRKPGKAREGEHEFMTMLTEPERTELRKAIKAEQDENSKASVTATDDLTEGMVRHDMPSEDEEAAVVAAVAKNPTRENTEALMRFRATQTARIDLHEKTPAQRNNLVRKAEANLRSRPGGGTADANAYVKALNTLNDADLKAIDENQLAFAIKAGIVGQTSLRHENDAALEMDLRARGNKSTLANEVLGGEKVFLLDGEGPSFLARVQSGDPAIYGVVSRALGPDAPAFWRELGNKNNKIMPRIAARTGFLFDLSPDNEAANDTAKFLKRFNQPRDGGFKWSLPQGSATATAGTLQKRRNLVHDRYGTVYKGMGDNLEQLREHADRIMDERMSDGTHSDWSDDAYKGILDELVGKTVEGTVSYGGLIEKEDNWGTGLDRAATVVPPEVQTDRFRDLIKHVNIEGLPEGARPVTSRGGAKRDMTNAEFQSADLQQARDGEWYLVQDNGPPVSYWGDPASTQQPPEPFVLRWEDVRGDLLKNHPGSFKRGTR
jgi:hypothetical protein